MFSILIYLLLMTTIQLMGDIAQIRSIPDYILCRTCGQDLSSSNFIISKYSPHAKYYLNDTLFDTAGVQIQVFLTDVYFMYPLITVAHSRCVETGEWEEATSWFPGYRWKPCVCPECGAYIGFYFEPISIGLESYNTFHGLILTSLISENFANSLIEFPVGPSQ